jgi:glycosyltransferase involved in cell wall biosynthesis
LETLVSVVIPTRNRSQLAKRAVQSALSQTLKQIEVMVIIDGPDEATVKELSLIDDSRLRAIELPISGGASEARNTGVNQAKGEWIAFLDDDDEWFPQKLEQQLEAAQRSHYAWPIIGSCLIARTPKGDFVRPKRFLRPSEPLSEYLLVRNSLFPGEGLIQTSVIFTKKELLEKIPFRDLRRHQDWDWLLRVSTLEGVGIEFVPEPLAIWYIEEKRSSVSSTSNWQNSLSWIRENRNLVTPRAYSAFIMVEVGPRAAQGGEWNSFLPLLWEAMRLGNPKPIDFLLYLSMWLIPQEARRSLRSLLGKRN